ncbi:MAG TPA: phosphoribosyl-AMP cyclohydrolase [Stellaceae bacterium]|nr:phosphoribosyl-AMP cyclohydrolase [Stellaceae bacterium]
MKETLEQALEQIKFDGDGLVPAIAQQHDTGEVLMMAWMNRAAVQVTLREGRACYWSRSRQRLWRKGETSGQVQFVRELRLDCDGDTVLLLVDQPGVACHTGRRSCFFRAWRENEWAVIAAPQIPPETLYRRSSEAADKTDAPKSGPL